MGWHINNTPKSPRFYFADDPYAAGHKRSPKYGRTQPTKRQRRVWRHQAENCPHSLSMQLGGGVCGNCGRRTTQNVHALRGIMEEHRDALEYLAASSEAALKTCEAQDSQP